MTRTADTPHGNTIDVTADGRVIVRGIDFETRRITVLCRNKNAIVLKIPGRSVWDGNYQPRRYVPPETMVYQILSVEKRGSTDRLTVKPLIEWECGRKKAEPE